MLVDGGPNDSVLNCLKNNMPFWDRTIEVIFVTHSHADHANGVIAVLKRYNVNYFFSQNEGFTSNFSKLQKTILAEKNLSATFFSKGKILKTKDNVELLTKWPKEDGILKVAEQNMDINGYSLIELLTYGKFKLLLTGDANIQSQEEILEEVKPITVLKVAHHGSKTGVSDKILRELNPRLGIISVGSKNSYGLPAPQTLGLLKQLGTKTLRTDKDGEIEIITDGNSYQVVTNN
ncbi:MBL fold metallo-hydrolase [Patescibacteria group bacterium]|nr:MBL fold metallo-hydrolase [Patescibacteria group bacterium]